MRKIVEFICLCGLCFCLNAEVGNDTVIILPFENTGDIQFEYLSDLMVTFLYTIIDKIEPFQVVQPAEMKKYKEGYINSTKSLATDSYYQTLCGYFQAEWVIDGSYFCSANEIIVNMVIFTRSDEKRVTRILKSQLVDPVSITFDNLFLSFVETMSTTILDSSSLTIVVDRPCKIFLDKEEYKIRKDDPILKIRLLSDAYELTIVPDTGKDEAPIFSDTIFIEKNKDKIMEFTVQVDLEITADLSCQVLIDGKNAGSTPFFGTLYTGREYALRVEYYHSDSKCLLVEEKVLSTREFLFQKQTTISLYLPVRSSIALTHPLYNLQSSLNQAPLLPLPCFYRDLLPQTYGLDVALEDPADHTRWIFYSETIELRPYEQYELDLSFIDYRVQPGLAFIPGLVQYHNKEPGKADAVLFTLATSALLCGTSAVIGQLYFNHYKAMADAFNETALGSGYTQDDVNRSYVPVAAGKSLFIVGAALFSVTYLYSLFDGIATMYRIDKLLNPVSN